MEKSSIENNTFVLSEFKNLLVRKKYSIFFLLSFMVALSIFALQRSRAVTGTQRYTTKCVEANRQCESKTLLSEGDNLVGSKDKQKNRVLLNETTCSYKAYRRGSGQKIVAFSYYSSTNRPSTKQNLYLSGIKGNLDIMPLLYPGWVMRIYIDIDANDTALPNLYKLVSTNPNIDLCHVQNLPGTHKKEASDVLGANWRFYPALDQQVKLMFK